MNFNLTEILKLPANIMSAISLAAGLVLFLPDSVLSKLYMVEFKDSYGFTIGIIFIVSTSILIIGFIAKLYTLLNNKYSSSKFKKNSKKLLVSLDTYKKAIVYMLYKEDSNTHTLPLNDGAVVFLEHYMVIQKATSQYVVSDIENPIFPYFLQPWVVSALENDEELLLSFKISANEQINKVQHTSLY